MKSVQSEVAHSRGSSMLGQIISRATRQQRDRGEPGSQLTEHLYHPGQRSCLVRIIDNWGQRAVEIEA
ncbi:MAG TPA: hypothetical protein VFW54_01290 [Propionibacteriaceae bacterium]|nr:hypothetical protein [Propionibacteriaceae bacterium]